MIDTTGGGGGGNDGEGDDVNTRFISTGNTAIDSFIGAAAGTVAANLAGGLFNGYREKCRLKRQAVDTKTAGGEDVDTRLFCLNDLLPRPVDCNRCNCYENSLEIATSAASQIATVATATTTGIAEIIATSAAAPTPARLVRSRGAAATAVDRPTDRAAAGDPHIGPVAAVHPTGPAAVEGHPTGLAPVGETVERAILPRRHLVAMESLLHKIKSTCV